MRLVPLVALVAALANSGCSGNAARESTASAPGALTTSARVGEPGSHGSARVMPATPEELTRVIQEGGAPVTLVNVWATWCKPCREEMPALLNVARRHPEVRFVFVSADFTPQLADARKFLAERAVSGTTYIKSGSDQDFIDALNHGWTGSIPATFIYDSAGRPVSFWEGEANEARFEAAITQAQRARP